MKRAALLVLLLAARAQAQAQSGADEHMLAGARHFQAGRYPEALVEFRVAQKMSDAGAIWYVAATLMKMKRPEDALVEFARAESAAPDERDGLLDYYHALACYDARLYFCADRLLATLGEQPGPRIAAQARKIRAELAPILSTPPPIAAVDWYHARAQEEIRAGRIALGCAYYDEAASLAALRPDAHRRAEALAALAQARHQQGVKAARQ
jgi:tetratricopeptide (TPR) repeat protein